MTFALWKEFFVEIAGSPQLPETMTVLDIDQGLQSHLFFLADFSDRIGKTKRTGYESGEYEMVCFVCVCWL